MHTPWPADPPCLPFGKVHDAESSLAATITSRFLFILALGAKRVECALTGAGRVCFCRAGMVNGSGVGVPSANFGMELYCTNTMRYKALGSQTLLFKAKGWWRD
jgi:hypothetical protein